jgi:metal-responsive CopG/Arc/MetJ family transcriptional regulator
MPGKTKVSVSVRSGLLREVERVAGEMSRSAVFEQALSGWLRHRRQLQLDQAIEEYYRPLPVSERAEDDRQ